MCTCSCVLSVGAQRKGKQKLLNKENVWERHVCDEMKGTCKTCKLIRKDETQPVIENDYSTSVISTERRTQMSMATPEQWSCQIMQYEQQNVFEWRITKKVTKHDINKTEFCSQRWYAFGFRPGNRNNRAIFDARQRQQKHGVQRTLYYVFHLHPAGEL